MECGAQAGMDGPVNERIDAPELAAPVGFSHAIRAGDTVYLGGQVAQAPDGTVVGETIVEQFGVAAGNLVTALRAAGGEPSDLVSLQVFVTAVAEYKASLRELGDVWRDALRAPLPGDGAVRRDRAVRSRGQGGADGRGGAKAARPMTAPRWICTSPPSSATSTSHTRELAADTWRRSPPQATPGRVNRPLVAALAEHGLLSRLFDGGQASAIELCLIREALARGCTEAETAFALQGLGAYPLLQAGAARPARGVDPARGRRDRARRLRPHRARRRL